MGQKAKTRSRAGAEDALPQARACPPEATDGAAPLTPPAARPSTPAAPRSNAGRAAAGGGKHTLNGRGLPEDPERIGGDAPRAGPATKGDELPDARQTISDDITLSPDEYVYSGDPDTLPLFPDIVPPSSGIPLPFSAEVPSRQVEPNFDDVKETPVPAWVGRNEDGTNIQYSFDANTAEKVAEWVALGATESQIAISLNMRPGKLRQLYFRELESGKFDHHMQVGSTILSLAKLGVPQAFTLFAQTQMKWTNKEKDDVGEGALNIHIHT